MPLKKQKTVRFADDENQESPDIIRSAKSFSNDSMDDINDREPVEERKWSKFAHNELQQADDT